MEAEVIVVGAGIAGASLAAVLAEDRKVLLLERESQPGYHTTGRSAATFIKTYGPDPIRALTRASEPFYRNPPRGFTEHPLLSPRGILLTVRPDQQALLDKEMEVLADEGAERLDVEAAMTHCPLLRRETLGGAILDPGGEDMEVHAIHQGYLKMLKAHGGSLLCNAEVQGLSRNGSRWEIETKAGTIRAEILVDAAGAWADSLGEMAGARPIGLVPKRRTAMIVAAPEDCDASSFCLTGDLEETFYLKPDAGKLLLSPADETPSPPCDAQPEELDVAHCVDRIERHFEISVRQIERKWAGLRSFVADKSPVVGWDPEVEGFFWLAGQGGYGIQTAPAMATTAAALLLGRPLPEVVAAEGLEPAALAPQRTRAPA